MMEHTQKNGKDIYIVDSHHEVLEAWVKYPNHSVLTFDYHTDTRPAFLKWAYKQIMSKANNCLGPTTQEEKQIEPTRLKRIAQYIKDNNIMSAISDLKYDEHLRFVVDTDIVKKVYICTWGNGSSTSEKNFLSNPYYTNSALYNNISILDSVSMPEDDHNEEIITLQISCTPSTAPSYNNEEIILFEIGCDFLIDCNKTDHDEAYQSDAANMVLEDSIMQKMLSSFSVIEPSICNTPFILDFDMDFFRTCQSLSPATNAVFTQLVQRATAITIAKEDKCCELCWVDSNPIDL